MKQRSIRRFLALSLTFFTLAGLVLPVSAAASTSFLLRPIAPGGESPFEDVAANHWYCRDVIDAVDQGLMSGVSETRFAPNDPLTRAMLVTALYRAESKPQVAFSEKFTDVQAGQYYSDAVIWAAENGLVEGSGGKFSPDSAISRQELATILWRCARYRGYDVGAHGMIVPDFADRRSIASWAGEAMCWAYTRGILQGSRNRLNPEGSASRAEAAAMLVRFQALPKSSDKNLVTR